MSALEPMKYEDTTVGNLQSKFHILLGSSSPRRIEIMKDCMGFTDLLTCKSSFKEDLDKKDFPSDPIGYVHATCFKKSEAILKEYDFNKNGFKPYGTLLICADTIVADPANVIYEKPENYVNRRANLFIFCQFAVDNEPIRVITSVNITFIDNEGNKQLVTHFEEVTKLYFDLEATCYFLQENLDRGDGIDAAGGFKIQGPGGILIKRIDGDYYNVVGLPLNKTFKQLHAISLNNTD